MHPRVIGRLRPALLVGVALIAAACGAARDEAWPTQLGEVQFTGAKVLGERAPDRSEIERALDSALAHTPLFRPVLGASDREPLALDLRVNWTRSEGGAQDTWMVAMSLQSPELMREKGAPPAFDVVLLVDLQPELPPDAARALALESAMGRGLSVLDAKSRLSLGAPEQAARLLQSTDLELRLLALNWVGTQGRRDDAELVRPFLREEDPRLVEAAIFALTRVGSVADVSALIAQTMHNDEVVARQAYVALGEIGGSQAEAYLRFAARNEDEPQRRRAAELALRSSGQSSSADQPPEPPLRSHRR